MALRRSRRDLTAHQPRFPFLLPLLEGSEYGSLSYVLHFLPIVDQLRLRVVSRFFQEVVGVSLSLRPPTLTELGVLMFRWNFRKEKQKKGTRSPRSGGLFRTRDGKIVKEKYGDPVVETVERVGRTRGRRSRHATANLRLADFLQRKASLNLFVIDFQTKRTTFGALSFVTSIVDLFLPADISKKQIPLLVWLWMEREEFGTSWSSKNPHASTGIVSETTNLSGLAMSVLFQESQELEIGPLSSVEAISEVFSKDDGFVPLFPATTWKTLMHRLVQGNQSLRVLLNHCEAAVSAIQETECLQSVVLCLENAQAVLRLLAERGVELGRLLFDPNLQLKQKVTLIEFFLEYDPQLLDERNLIELCSNRRSFCCGKIFSQLCDLVDVNAIDDTLGWSCLMHLVATKRTPTESRLGGSDVVCPFATLVMKGADVNFVSADEVSLLGLCLHKKLFPTALWLLEHGANLSLDCEKELHFSLHELESAPSGPELLRKLLSLGIDQRLLMLDRESRFHLIHHACYHDQVNIVTVLLSAEHSDEVINLALRTVVYQISGGFKREIGRPGHTPLLIACSEGKERSIDVLLNDSRCDSFRLALTVDNLGNSSLMLLLQRKELTTVARQELKDRIAEKLVKKAPEIVHFLANDSRSAADLEMKNCITQRSSRSPPDFGLVLKLLKAGCPATAHFFEGGLSSRPFWSKRAKIQPDITFEESSGQRLLKWLQTRIAIPWSSMKPQALTSLLHSGDTLAISTLIEIGFDVEGQFPRLYEGLSNGSVKHVVSACSGLGPLIHSFGGFHRLYEEFGPSRNICILACHFQATDILNECLERNSSVFPKATRIKCFEACCQNAGTGKMIGFLLSGGYLSFEDELREMRGKTLLQTLFGNKALCREVFRDFPDLRVSASSIVPVVKYILGRGEILFRRPLVSLFANYLQDTTISLSVVLSRTDIASPDLAKWRGCLEYILCYGACVGAAVSSLPQRLDLSTRNLVRQLLIRKQLGTCTITCNYSLLHFACSKGNLEVAELLLQNGANVNIKSSGELTPLQLAAQGSHREIVRRLLHTWNASVSFDFRRKYGFLL